MTANEWAILMATPLFKAMGPDIVRSVVQSRTAQFLERGAQIFQQGDAADAFFFIFEGWVKLYRQREDGEEVVVTICTAGETFAEGAMFMGGRYPVSAETVSFARIIRVDGAALRRAIEQRPQLAFDMLAAASGHLRLLVAQIEQLKVQSVPQRIADFLLRQGHADDGPLTIALPYEKALIANRLGMTPESFSRGLAKLRALGVEVERDKVRIADVAKLTRYARKKAVES
jgi:CRP-like cAMP-binding protein